MRSEERVGGSILCAIPLQKRREVAGFPMDNAGQDELCSGRTADRPEREAVGLGQSEKFGHAVASRWRWRRQQALAHLWGQLHRFGKLAEGQRAAAGVVGQGNGLRCRLGGRRDLH